MDANQMDDSNIKEIMKPYRARIDALDDELIDMFVERFGIIREVADVKYANGIPATIAERVDEVRERNVARAVEKGLDPELFRTIYAMVIKASCDLEDDIMAEKRKSEAA